MFGLLTASIENLDSDEILFPKLGIDLHVDSEAFSLFGLVVSWYGLLITVGMLIAMVYFFKNSERFGLDSNRAMDGIIAGVIGGIAGARAYYVAFHWPDYAGDWRAIFNIRAGGLGIYGGIIGALLIGSVACKIRKVRLLPMYDLIALGFLIGQGIGRWGNFTNHEAFGGNTEWVTGMTSGKIQAWIATHYPDGSVSPDIPVHPCFFYESVWCLLGFVVLHFISKKRKFDGEVFLCYLAWYGTGRFFIEALRTDSLYLGTIKVSQLVAVVTVTAAVILLCVGFSHAKRMGADYQLYVNTEESRELLAEAARKEREELEKHARKKEKNAPPPQSVIAEDEEPEESPEELEAEAEKRRAEQARRKAENDALIAEIAAEAEKKQNNENDLS